MKPTLLLPILVLFGLSCSAQISFNVKAGVNMSFFRNYNNVAYSSSPFGKIEEKPKFGIQVGLGSDIKLSEDISLRPEMIYNQKGFIVEDNDQSIYTSGPNSGYEMTWHYIDLPILLKARVHKNIFIEFGPYLSFLLNAHFEKTSSPFDVRIPENQTGYYSKIDAGINSGILYSYRKFEIGTRYLIGLTEIKVNEAYSDPEFSYEGLLPFGRHRVLQFFVSYKFK